MEAVNSCCNVVVRNAEGWGVGQGKGWWWQLSTVMALVKEIILLDVSNVTSEKVGGYTHLVTHQMKSVPYPHDYALHIAFHATLVVNDSTMTEIPSAQPNMENLNPRYLLM